MRIAQVFSTPWPPGEGIATYVHGLTTELRARGHEVSLFTRGPRTQTRHDDSLDADVTTVFCPPVHPFHVHVQEIAFRHLLRSIQARFDVFHVHTPYPPLPPDGSPSVVTVHTPMVSDAASIPERTFQARLQKAQSAFLRKREARIFRSAGVLASVSQAVADEMVLYGLDPRRVQVVGNGVDTRRYAAVASPTRDYFLYTGRLGPRKGLEDLMMAAIELSRDAPGFELRLTGRGPLEAHLRGMVASARAEDKIHFLGHVAKTELPGLYANARACVIPSHYEGLPTVLLEAMASATPVIATDIPGIREVVPSGERAELVKPGDPRGLAARMRRVLAEDAGTLERRGHALRRVVEERYTWRAIADAYEKLYGAAYTSAARSRTG